MQKPIKRTKARSKNHARRGKTSRKSAGQSKGPAATTATALRSTSAVAFDSAKVEAQTRLEQAAFEQLTPGLSLTAADLSKSIPFVPGLIRFRLLRPEDLLVMEIETTDLEFRSQAAQDDTGEDAPHLVPSGSKGGLLICRVRLPARRRKKRASKSTTYQIRRSRGDQFESPRAPPIRAAWCLRSEGRTDSVLHDGIIATMSRLEMVVAPVAMPREAIAIGSIQIGAAPSSWPAASALPNRTVSCSCRTLH